MTFAEAKDKAAKEVANAESFDKFNKDVPKVSFGVGIHLRVLHRAGELLELYAASVREEAIKCPGCGSTHRICQNCMLITH